MELNWGARWQKFIRSFITNQGYKDVLRGLGATATIAVLGLIIGIVIGTLIAVVRVLPKYKRSVRVLDKIMSVYVGFFRGTPMVVQLLLGYFVILPLLNIPADGITVAIIIFGLNSGAYVSEIMRSGILSVDRGQLEAGRAVGLSYPKTMISIVIPQAIKNILPTLGNEFIVLLKETSIVSFIAVVDLTKAFRSIGDANYEYMIPYLMLAVVYLVIIMVVTYLVRLIERRLAKSDRT